MAKRKEKKFNPNPGTSEFNGGLLGYIGITLLASFIMLITLFIGTPWAECMIQRWVAKHTKINGKQVVFDGKGIQLFGKYIAWFILGVITIGIFWLWLPIKKQKWIMKHTYVEETQETNNWYANYPAMPPRMTPRTVMINTEINPMMSEIRPPYINLVNTS